MPPKTKVTPSKENAVKTPNEPSILSLPDSTAPIEFIPEFIKDTYEYLLYQPKESFDLIQACNEGNEELVSKILRESNISTSIKYDQWLEKHSRNDISALQNIESSVMVDAAFFGNSIALKPYQMALWLTMTRYIYFSVIESIISYKSGKSPESLWKNNLRSIFFKYISLSEDQNDSTSTFTVSSIKRMLSYYLDGFGQHFNLYIHIVTLPQANQKVQIHKSLEFVTSCLEPLSLAIAANDWENYCKSEQERIINEEKAAKEAEELALASEIERIKAEKAEAHFQSLKSKLLEAEKAMLLPIPTYPVPPPEKPSIDTLFRKITNEHMMVRFSARKEETDKTESVTGITIPTNLQLKKVGNLPPPPDMSKSKPLERSYKMKQIMDQGQTSDQAIPEFIPEYEYIPIERKLNRQEVAEYVQKSLEHYVSCYKNWSSNLMEYEQEQWSKRLLNLQKCKKDRDEWLEKDSRIPKSADKKNKPPKENERERNKKK